MILFSDGSDLVGITRTQDIKYMRILRLVISVIPAWPGYMLGEPEDTFLSSPLKLFFNSIQFIYLICGIIFVKVNFGKLSFFEMGQTYVTLFMNFVCAYRGVLVWTKKHSDIFKQFLNEIHLFNHRNKSAYHMKMHLRIHKLCHFYTVYITLFMLLGEILFQLVPILNSANNGGFRWPPPENVTYELSVYIALPFDYEHNLLGFIVMQIVNTIECNFASNYFCILDAYLALLMFHLWGHLQILIYSLESFPRPVPRASTSQIEYCERYSYEELLDVRQKLKEIVELHTTILKYIKEVSSTFGLSIALIYAFYQVSGCVLLVECSQLDPKALMRYGPLTLILLQLMVVMSVIFELIRSQTNRLANAVYFLPWEFMDVSNRKTCLIILRQAQIPLGLKAVGMVEVGCQTMASILKTSISYFVILRTMAIKE